MRNSAGWMAAKFGGGLLMLAMAIGIGFGEDRKPIADAPAVQPDAGQWVMTFREEVRYLSPTGRERQRLNYEQAKAVDDQLLTGQFSIGQQGLFKIERFLPSAGRAGPGGVIPLNSRGTRLLTPGEKPSVRLVTDEETQDQVVGWSADGKRYLASGPLGGSLIFGVTGFQAFWVDTTTGEREPFKIDTPLWMPDGSVAEAGQFSNSRNHTAIDVASNGQWILSIRHLPRPFNIPGMLKERWNLCITDMRGQVRHECPGVLASPEQTQTTAFGRVSSDGRAIAAITSFVQENKVIRSSLSVTRFGDKNEMKVEYRDYPTAEKAMKCRGVAWSPTGEQIVSAWTHEKPSNTTRTWHIMIADADGGNLKHVTTIDTKGDEVLRDLSWR